MKPLKTTTFWIIITSVVVLFTVIFAFWTYTMVKNFRDVSSTSDPAVSPAFEKLNIDTYKRLFPEDKE